DFRGVVIGEVTDINLDYDPAKKTFIVPVQVKLYPERLRGKFRNGKPIPDTKHLFDTLVERGFRGQLRLGNLVTQQLYIALDFFPDVAKAKVDWNPALPILPTTTGTVEELQVTLTRILKKLDKLPLDAISGDLRAALQTFRETLQKTDQLVS